MLQISEISVQNTRCVVHDVKNREILVYPIRDGANPQHLPAEQLPELEARMAPMLACKAFAQMGFVWVNVGELSGSPQPWSSGNAGMMGVTFPFKGNASLVFEMSVADVSKAQAKVSAAYIQRMKDI